jgi:hypothetical protein
MKKVTVGFKCSPEQKQNLQAKADEQGLTLSTMMEMLNDYQPVNTMENQQTEQTTLPTTAPIETTDITIKVRSSSALLLMQEAKEQGMTLPLYVKKIVMERNRDPEPKARVADAMEQLLVILNSQTKLIERSVANSEAMLNHVVGHTEQRPTAPPPTEQKEVVRQFPVVPDPWKGMSAGNRAFMERLRSDHGTQWFDSHLDGLGTVQRECNAGAWLPIFRKFERMGLMEIRAIGTQGRRLRIRARFMFITKQP